MQQVLQFVICSTFVGYLFVLGAVLCKLNELTSAEQILSSSCHDSYTHVSLHLAALLQLADCLAAQVDLLLYLFCVVQQTEIGLSCILWHILSNSM